MFGEGILGLEEDYTSPILSFPTAGGSLFLDCFFPMGKGQTYLLWSQRRKARSTPAT